MPNTTTNHGSAKTLALALAGLALAALASAAVSFRWLLHLQHAGPAYTEAFSGNSIASLMRWTMAGDLLGVIVLGAAASMAVKRRPGSLPWIRPAFTVAYVLVALHIYVVVGAVDVMLDKQLPFGDGVLDVHSSFLLKWRYNLPAIGALLAIVAVHLLSWRSSVVAAFGKDQPVAPVTAEHAIIPLNYLGFSPDQRVSLRGRPDAGYRNGISASIFIHVLAIFVIPWMLTSRGCSLEAYLLPGGGGGGGGGGGQPVFVKIQKKQPKRRKYVFRPNSAISFHTMNLDDSQVQKIVDVTTEEVYEANTNDVNIGVGPGGQGEGFGGGGGKGGGWAGGDANAKIRFIRLEYKGAAWDDGMDATSRADQNFLDELHKASHLNVTTLNTGEHITVAQLRNFKKGQQPPFLFMTGEGSIDLSDAETKVIRQYLLDGGLLFCDCGSATWDQSFRQWSRRLFPDKPLLDISNDDPIFHAWFHFPNGAPPLWKHGGDRALGIKDNGRWTVFYFPGNLNDAWKTGHNDVNPTVVRQSYELGVNVVKYSIDHYWAMNRQNGK